MASPPKEQSNPGKKSDTFAKLDEAYAESSMEEQLIVYWNRHKNQILMGLTGAALLIVGFQLSNWWSQKSVGDRAEAYAAATEDSEKEAFADKFSGTDLGGIAYLELADKEHPCGFQAHCLDSILLKSNKRQLLNGLIDVRQYRNLPMPPVRSSSNDRYVLEIPF